MRLLLLLFLLGTSLQAEYRGTVVEKGRILNCGAYLNRYVHGGLPGREEDPVVRTCCRVLRRIASSGYMNPLLEVHLKVCRQMGR
jgi:hypothetical protein